MKSLKRTLSLVLVLVMVLGLFGVAGAAFTDDAKIQYKEAVGVMTGIGAIEGMGDGTFAPTGTLTRAQAAKMVTYTILGKGLAESLSGMASSFKDVTVAGGFGWAIPSIEYLKNQGIVEGRGDGIYDPNGKVTGYELGKMLLVALGYGHKDEFAGPDFTLGVAILANDIDLFAGRAKTAGKLGDGATREEAALYCFNALNIKPVVYNKFFDTYTSTATTIGEKVYKLKSDTVTAALNGGVEGKRWFLDKNANGAYNENVDTLIGVYNAASESYTFGAGTTFAEMAKAAGVLNTSAKNYSVENYRNGRLIDTNTLTGAAIYAIPDKIPNGCVYNVVVTATGTIRLLQTRTYIASVASVTKDTNNDDTDDRAITINIMKYGNADAPYSMTIKSSNYSGFDAIWALVKDATTASLTKNPVMALVVPTGDSYTYSTSLGATDTKLLSVSIPKVVSGTVKGYAGVVGNEASSVNIDGTAYKYAHNYAAAPTNAFAITASQLGTEATILVDANGFVYFGKNETAATAYATVIAYATNTTGGLAGGTKHEATLLFTDGTTKTVELTAAPDSWAATASTPYTAPANQGWYTYEINAKGQYTLGITKVANATDTVAGAVLVTSNDKTLTNGSPAFDGKTVNNETVFVVRSGAGTAASPYTFKAYTGYRNVPTITSTSYLAYATKTAGVAKYVYVFAGAQSGVADTSTKALVISATPNVQYVDATTVTYTYKVAIDGKIAAIVSKNAALTLTAGNLYSVDIDKDGYVVGTTDGGAGVAFNGATASDGVLGFTATAINTGATEKTAYTYDGAESVYILAKDGTVSIATVEALVTAEALKNYNVTIAVKGLTSAANSVAIATIWAVEK